MHRTSEVLLPFCVTNLCSFQYVPVVCACLLVKYVDFFSQFDVISPVHLGVRVGSLPEDRWWGFDYRRRLCWRSLFRIHPSGSLEFD